MKTKKNDIGKFVEAMKDQSYTRAEAVELVIEAWDLGFRKAMDKWDEAINERNGE